ncbi:hypothetical protein [Polyangium sp. y55x31]|uniref:hypothetical protein n=1 Tax=Polyangium sp. y55x31 TaxID=3042688 RepID=UPI0024829E8D|nr:hypothetical protein [Polyangium sp. y55x31]MDI1480377.1 hypothetical protein [Polyangium sp. y55x31]
MKKSTVSLGFALILAVGSVFAQVAPPSLSARLSAVGQYYGDANGKIPLHLTGGGVLYVATANGTSPFSIYTVNDTVASGATVGACALDAAGAPVGCDPAYGELMLYALADLQSSEPDPSELTISCRYTSYPDLGRCAVTWGPGDTTCYKYDSGTYSVTECL